MNKAFYSFPAIIVVLSLFSVGRASAQTSDISPYSRYGIGDLQDQNSVLNFSMGGTGIAYHNDATAPFFINLKNPASYAYGFIPSPVEDSSGRAGLKMAAFEAGIQDNILNLSSEGQTSSSNNAYLAYVTLNIPVSKHFGLAMGLTPVSSEGYNILTTNIVDSDGAAHPSSTSTTTTYEGSGGISKVFIGGAYAPFKNLSIGANLSYLFGNLTNTEEIDFNNPNIYNTLKAENVGIHSFDADFGIMYTIHLIKNADHLEKNWYVTFGATLAPSVNLNANYNILTVTQNSVGTNMDTLQDSGSVGKIRIPLTYGFGITIKKGDNWTLSLDRTGQNWSQYSYFGQSENLTDSYTWSAGIQYVPKKDFPRTYAQRIHYRAGFSYSLSYLDLDNTPLLNRNFSAGVGLPIGASGQYEHPSVLNIALRVGSMGTTTNNLIQQNYVQIMVGFTFDDHWFDKHLLQ
jgi:hypothetical protein